MFNKILIANRGEVALRVQRACRELGIQTVMIYSEGDVGAKYLRLADEAVCIGPAAVDKSYLNAAAIIAAAEITESEAIHPGYGLLSENADFAEQAEKSGFVFIGPPPSIIRMMGDKILARDTIRKYGLKTIPGSQGALSTDDLEVAQQFRAIGFPLMIKAAAGGGGRGMRLVHSETQAMNTLPILRREAMMGFGDETLYAERYLANPRHIEVQVLSDSRQAIHLGTRDCSLQRRHQKIIEEAPAPKIPTRQHNQIVEACTHVCRKIGYRGAGTFEFLYEAGIFYFIEMNTRLQVEHTVTEMISDIDIVVEQIRIAAGLDLSIRQKEVVFRGHSIECRINAEDPKRNFMPSPGRIDLYHMPGGLGVRVDSHVYSGYEVPPYYDSLIAKLVVHAPNRELALSRMSRALSEYIIVGIMTNLSLHQSLLTDANFCKGDIDINYLEKLYKF